MKICQVCYDFPPGVGGSETHNYTLVKYLLKRNYDVDVIVIRQSVLPKNVLLQAAETINKGINVHDIFPVKPFFWMVQLKKKIQEIEKNGKIDVFDVHNGLLAVPLSAKRKIIRSLHFFDLSCPLPSFLAQGGFQCFASAMCMKCCGIKNYAMWKMARMLELKKFAKIVVKYKFIRELAVKSGIDRSKIVVIPHWIDVETIREKSRNNLRASVKGLEESDQVFGFLSRLEPQKGPFLLLKAFASLSEKRADAKLVFIGGGTHTFMQQLKQFCLKHNLQNKVIFLGAIPYTRVHNYLSIPNIFVFCSPYVNYNWALLEAMCTEKPMIVTNDTATSEILRDNYNALLSPPNVDSLASRMLDILEDPKMAKKIAKNAFRTVKSKHSYKNLEKYEEVLKS